MGVFHIIWIVQIAPNCAKCLPFLSYCRMDQSTFKNFFIGYRKIYKRIQKRCWKCKYTVKNRSKVNLYVLRIVTKFTGINSIVFFLNLLYSQGFMIFSKSLWLKLSVPKLGHKPLSVRCHFYVIWIISFDLSINNGSLVSNWL